MFMARSHIRNKTLKKEYKAVQFEQHPFPDVCLLIISSLCLQLPSSVVETNLLHTCF